MTKLVSSIAVLLAGLAISSSAFAQGKPDARAVELKKKADALFDDRRYEEAVTAYDDAYAAYPNPALLYNRGSALQSLARYPAALDSIQRFANEAPPDVRAKVPGLQALIADLQSKVAVVTINCSVANTRVLVGGTQVGTCPFSSPVSVNAGPQSVEAFADGYTPFRKQLELKGGPSALDIALTPKSTTGILLVRSRVDGASVAVDGAKVGAAPATADLAPGDHQVKVEKDGYDPANMKVAVRAGERTEVLLDPTGHTSVLGRWWFWTGLAVVAAGVTTMVIAFSTESSAPSGDFSPGQVHF